MLALPRQGFGQAGKAVGPIPQSAEPTGKPLPQAGDGLLEAPCALSARRAGTAVPR